MTRQRQPPAQAHLPLHPLEFQILLSLLRGPAHAYAIVRSIEDRQPDWSRILPTNMYRRIYRLESKGLLVEVENNDQLEAGRRKYFSTTRMGRAVAEAEATRLSTLLREAKRAGISGMLPEGRRP